MKKIFMIFTIVFLFAAYAAAQDVSITDYKVPVSMAKSLLLNADYNYSAVGDSTVANVGNGRVLYKHFYSSLPFSWNIDVDASGSKLDDETRHSVYLTTGVNKYLSDESNFFGFGRLQASHVKGFKQMQSRLSTGAGYGRFISATAFAKAIRIDNFLLKEDVITGHLDKETLIKLGNIIEREAEFKDKYGATYEPRWYETMEEVIKASGKLEGETLGAMGILRIKEVLFYETIHDRFYGWDVRAGVGYDITTADKSDTDPSAEAAFSFSYPISLSTQINHRTQYNSNFGDFGNEYTIVSATDYIYELSNRIDFMGSYQFQSVKATATEDALNGHALRTSFIFYIENKINFVVNGHLDKTGELDWNKSITFTLGYRIW